MLCLSIWAALIFYAYGLTGKRPELLMKEVRSAYDQEQNHQQIVEKRQKEYDIQTFQRVFKDKIILTADQWSEPLSRLYQIFVNLKFLSHLDSYFQFYHQSSQYTYYMQPSDCAHEDCWNHIFEALDEMNEQIL